MAQSQTIFQMWSVYSLSSLALFKSHTPPGFTISVAIGKAAFFILVDQIKSLVRHLEVGDINPRKIFEIVKREYIEFRIFRAIDKYSPRRNYDDDIVAAGTVKSRKISDTDLAMDWGELVTRGALVHKMRGNNDNRLVDYVDELGDFLDSCQSEQPGD